MSRGSLVVNVNGSTLTAEVEYGKVLPCCPCPGLSGVHVQIVSSDLLMGHWVVTSVNSTFTVEQLPGFDESIPPDTFYTWHLVPADGLHLQPITQATGRNMFTYSFPEYGHYELSVIGNHTTGSFSAQIGIIAES